MLKLQDAFNFAFSKQSHISASEELKITYKLTSILSTLNNYNTNLGAWKFILNKIELNLNIKLNPVTKFKIANLLENCLLYNCKMSEASREEEVVLLELLLPTAAYVGVELYKDSSF